MKKLILFALLVIAFSATSGRILNVPDQFPTIQAGIDSSANGDTVLVAPGTYREAINYNRHNIVVGSLFITTGQESYIYTTIINASDFGSTVVTIEGLTDTISAIIGMSIQHGISVKGGGIYCNNSVIRVYSNYINSNTAIDNGENLGFGGGLYFDSSSAIIFNNRISGNLARCDQNDGGLGGGIYSTNSILILNDNVISSNIARCYQNYGGLGAGIYCVHSTLEFFRNSIFGNIAQSILNSGGSGGGAYCISSSGEIGDNIFSANSAQCNAYGGKGGGLFISNCTFSIHNDSISWNGTRSLMGGDSGAGIYCESSYLSLINNYFLSNSTYRLTGGYSGYGGALSLYSSTIQFTGNSIENNTCSYGGGIYFFQCAGNYYNNRITNNSSLIGGGIYIDEWGAQSISISNNFICHNNASIGAGLASKYYRSNALIRNNTITYNHADSIAGGIFNFGNVNSTIIWGNTAPLYPQIFPESTNVAFSDVDGGWYGEFNINADPVFRDSLFHLASTSCGDSMDSPCIDAGSFLFSDSLLNCDYSLGTYACDIGAFGGGLNNSHGVITYYVPRDYQSIQLAISHCISGDTIIVVPGIYQENIDYFGKNIVVASLYIYTNDTTYISSTILDGNSNGSVVKFKNRENSDAKLIGFTIQNGHAPRGGAIYCKYAYPTITNNVIMNNQADSLGGGIYCDYSTAIIKNNSIIDNLSLLLGGGIVCDGSVYWNYRSPYVVDNLILNNSGTKGAGVFCRHSNAYLVGNIISNNMGLNGGGLYIENCGPKVFNNVLYSNSADSSGGGLYLNNAATPNISNSIIRNNGAPTNPEIFVNSGNRFSLNYSNISGGWQGVGNVDIDPLFRSVGNSDFHLVSIACGDSANSPCIDLGDPILFDTLLTCDRGLGIERSDMGAYGGGILSQVGIDDAPVTLPLPFSLSQNYPNPFNPATTIKYDLPSPCRVRIDIYDILGRRVATLTDEEQVAGAHQAIWNASDKSSGIYFYRIQAGEFVETKKMMLMK